MKTKLTITIDSDLLPRAKRHARAKGVSLSAIIESALRAVSEEETPSFVQRWRGAFVAADRQDERYRALARKYL
jgi:post-segregation antitoxin (ccd killing protein)